MFPQKRQSLETEFRMLKEVGFIDEAKGVLEQVKTLRRELASPPPPLPEISLPALTTDERREMETIDDDVCDVVRGL
jgi:hypothetical protein